MAHIEQTGMDVILQQIESLKGIPNRAQLAKIGEIGRAGIQSNLEGNPLGLPDIAHSTTRAKGSTQIGVDKAHMKNATFKRVVSATEVQIVNNDPKVEWFIFGTPPHVIEPKFRAGGFLNPKTRKRSQKMRRSLAFIGADGETHFAKKVNHPGTPPRNFMQIRPATLKEIEAEVMSWFKKK